jgi:hypothetical protein
MKKIKITLLIAISVFLSFGFVLLKEQTVQEPSLEQVEPLQQNDKMQPIQESNEDIW